MAIIKTQNDIPIYQTLCKGQVGKTIQVGADLENGVELPLTNQDEITIKDFYDSEGKYIQLKAIQIAPYDTYGVYDDKRENQLHLFAQNKLNDSELDDFGYIGSINVDKNFKLTTMQDLIDDPNFQSYFQDNYNNTFQFVYDDFDGSQNTKTVIFGNDNINSIESITIDGVTRNYLKLYDVFLDKANGGQGTDTWSILYIPYVNGTSIEVLLFAMLKNTTTIIDKFAQPRVKLQYISNNPELELYNMEIKSDYFFSAKAGIAAAPKNINVASIDNGEIVLNQSEDLLPLTEGEENTYNPFVWPFINKELDTVISLENCYYSFDLIDWYPIILKDEYNKIIQSWIDLSKIPNVSYKDNELNDKYKNIDYLDFKITDKDENNKLNKNGNILLQAYNTLSIPIFNNFLKINKAELYDNESNLGEVSLEEKINNNRIFFTYEETKYYSYLKPYKEEYILDVYDMSNKIQDYKLNVTFANNRPLYLRVYKEGNNGS